MKHFIIILFLLPSIFLSAKGIEFFQGTWEEALEKAAAEEKIIFVDAYAEWCGPCKQMARNVFTDSEVGDYYNANFLNLKIDMEKPKNATFSKKYPVAAFPTLYYIDFTGKVVEQVKGSQTVEQFIALGRKVSGKSDRSAHYAEAYENGDRSTDLVYKYVKSLNKAGKPSLKISNDYFNAQTDFTTAENLRFLLEAAVESDSRIFDLLIKHRAAVEKVSSVAAVNKRIEQAAKASLKKAVEYDSEALLKETQQKMKQSHKAKGLAFYLESEMLFAQKKQDADRYLKAWKKYVSKVASDDAEEQSILASALARSFPTHKAGLAAAEKVAAKAANNSEAFNPKLIYANLLITNGKKEAAKKIATQAMYLAKQSGNRMNIAKASQVIKRLEE